MTYPPILSDEDWSALVKFAIEHPIQVTRVNLNVWESMTQEARHRFIMTSEGPAGLIATPEQGDGR